MATLSLRVSVFGSNAVKTMQFDPGLQVFDACRIVRDKVPEANQGTRKQPLSARTQCSGLPLFGNFWKPGNVGEFG